MCVSVKVDRVAELFVEQSAKVADFDADPNNKPEVFISWDIIAPQNKHAASATFFIVKAYLHIPPLPILTSFLSLNLSSQNSLFLNSQFRFRNSDEYM